MIGRGKWLLYLATLSWLMQKFSKTTVIFLSSMYVLWTFELNIWTKLYYLTRLAFASYLSYFILFSSLFIFCISCIQLFLIFLFTDLYQFCNDKHAQTELTIISMDFMLLYYTFTQSDRHLKLLICKFFQSNNDMFAVCITTKLINIFTNVT